MAILTNEYTDIRNVRHEVKHFIRTTESKANREEGLSKEQILQELFQIFSKPRKHAPV